MPGCLADGQAVDMEVDGAPSSSEAQPAAKKARTATDSEPSAQTASVAEAADPAAETTAAPAGMDMDNPPAVTQSTGPSTPTAQVRSLILECLVVHWK